MDLDMWDRSDFTDQSSTWRSLTCISAGGFRRREPGLRKWRSMYRLEPVSPTRSFLPLGAELWAGRGETSFRYAQGVPWFQEAHEQLNTKLDWLRTREITLGCNKPFGQTLNMEHKLLSKTTAASGQDEFHHFDQRQEKVLQLENELLHMRSSLENISEDQPTCRLNPASQSKSPKTPGDMEKQEKENPTTEVRLLGEALRKAEAKATTLQEERNKTLQELQTSEEDKAVLSTQVLELEDNVKELKTKLTDALSAKDDLNEVNEKLKQELEIIIKHLAVSRQLQELNEERIRNSRQIRDLEAECSPLVSEKEELLSMKNKGGQVGLNEKKNNSHNSTSVEDLKLENLKLRSQCLCLEEKLRDKEKMLQLQKETYIKKDEMRILSIKELEGVASHWTEKWQNVALTLQSTEDELEELKTNYNIDKKGSESLLRSEFKGCKEDKGNEMMQTLNKETQTDFSESDLTNELPSDSPFSRNKSPQVWGQSNEVQKLKQKLAETERDVSEREHDLRKMERLREMERTEAQMKISDLEQKLLKKVSEDFHIGPSVQTDVTNPAPMNPHQDENGERSDEMTSPEIHKYLTKRRMFPLGKNENLSVEDKKSKTICPVNPEVEQQRRMVTEQLKRLFKEREGKDTERFAETQVAAQSGSSTAQGCNPTSLAVKVAVDRRNWQQGSALMPVLEEDEGNSD